MFEIDRARSFLAKPEEWKGLLGYQDPEKKQLLKWAHDSAMKSIAGAKERADLKGAAEERRHRI